MRTVVGVVLVAVGLTACAGVEAAPTPIEIQEALSAVTAEAGKLASDLEAECVHRQGFETFKAPTQVQVLGRTPNLLPAEELLTYDDAELLKLHDLSVQQPPPQDPNLDLVRFESVTIDGRHFPGGCRTWAEETAREQTKYLDLAERVQDNLNVAVEREASQLTEVSAEFRACLSTEVRNMILSEGPLNPGALWTSLTWNALAALNSSSDTKVIRAELRKLTELERQASTEITSCQELVDWEKRFDEVRSDSIATAFAGEDMEEFLKDMQTR